MEMNKSIAMRASTALLIAAVGIGAAGCDNNAGLQNSNAPVPTGPPAVSTSKSVSTPAPKTIDYMRLLIQPSDVATSKETFAAQSPVANPDGRVGAEILLVNQTQTRGVSVIILGVPESGAQAALEDAKQGLAKSIASPNPQPSPVGTNGSITTGMSPDGSKSVTVLLFTEGPAVARLEFDGLPGQPTPEQFVTDTGQKQAIALRVGLAD